MGGGGFARIGLSVCKRLLSDKGGLRKFHWKIQNIKSPFDEMEF